VGHPGAFPLFTFPKIILNPHLCGVSSKNISHATMSSQSPFPQVQLVRGNLFLTLGHTIRPPYDPTKGKSPALSTSAESAPATSTGNTSSMELLPEEALYLLERGSLQIWCAPSAYDPLLPSNPTGEAGFEWDDAVQGFKGCVEMTVLEGFSRFIGRDGLTLERYQVSFSALRCT
jgi:tRNA-splicing endonuclease subunit Sen54